MKNPLVTVIIPCYNYANYVGEAIDSVLQQSYKNVELIVINDGSTDNSLSSITNKQATSNFSIINQKNKGIVYTRNKGIEAARGDFILQLDADDTIPKGYLKSLVGEMISHKADICYTQAVNLKTKEVIIKLSDFNLEKLKIHNYIHSSALVRSKTLKQYAYDKNLSGIGYEDWDIFLSMCLDGAKAVPVSGTSLSYRIHDDRLSRSDKLNGTVKELDANRYILLKHIKSHPSTMNYMSVIANRLLELREAKLNNQHLMNQNAELSEKLNAITNMKLFRAAKAMRAFKRALLARVRR